MQYKILQVLRNYYLFFLIMGTSDSFYVESIETFWKIFLLFSRNPIICYALTETLLKIDFLISNITIFTWTINSQRFNYSVRRYEPFPLKAQCIGSAHPFRQWLQTNIQYKLCEYVLITFSQFPNTWQSGSQSD